MVGVFTYAPTVKMNQAMTKSLLKEAKVAVPDIVLDRAHRIGPSYTDRMTSKKCKASLSDLLDFDTRLYSIGQEKI